MGRTITAEEFNEFLQMIGKENRIFAPKRYEKRGRFSDTDLIKYGEIKTFEEIVWNEKSDFSPKEMIFPASQTMFYFNKENITESTVDNKGIIIFLRPCDINGIERLDTIFLKNGTVEDPYYKRVREKVKYIMIECTQGFENCFCTVMNTNKTDNYSMAVRAGEKIKVEIKDEEWRIAFQNMGEKNDFKPIFIEKNIKIVNVPMNEKMPKEIFEHKMWEEYSKRCIACGRCNTACITCSCFTTKDIQYEDNKNAGERRRVWAGCHIDKFSDMAGGHGFRNKNGQRMRFKVMHKIYDFRKRFGKNMCVGCGRCDDICPEYISFAECINKVSKTLEELKGAGNE